MKFVPGIRRSIWSIRLYNGKIPLSTNLSNTSSSSSHHASNGSSYRANEARPTGLLTLLWYLCLVNAIAVLVLGFVYVICSFVGVVSTPVFFSSLGLSWRWRCSTCGEAYLLLLSGSLKRRNRSRFRYVV